MGKTLRLKTAGMILVLALCGLGRGVAVPTLVIGVAPQSPSDRDVVALSFTLTPLRCTPLFETAISGNRITLTGRTNPFPVAACLQVGDVTLPIGPLAAGFYSVDLSFDGSPLGSTTWAKCTRLEGRRGVISLQRAIRRS